MTSIYFLVFLSLLFMGIILPGVFKAGYFFSARTYFFQGESSLRPFFFLELSCMTLALQFLAVAYLQWKKKIHVGIFALLLFFSLFLGVRSILLGGILFLYVYRIFLNAGRTSLVRLALFCGILFLAAIYLDSLRHQQSDLWASVVHFGSQMFYGNHFSDTRDFAWVMSKWDGNFLCGKTYLAGILSFPPKLFSEFRGEWSYGSFVTALLDFDPSVNPGLRPGPFGEVFLNFNLMGVIVLGFIGGYALRFADVHFKEAVLQGNIIRGYAKTFVYFFVACFFNTAAFWNLYFFIFANLFLLLFSRGQFSKHSLYKRL